MYIYLNVIISTLHVEFAHQLHLHVCLHHLHISCKRRAVAVESVIKIYKNYENYENL